MYSEDKYIQRMNTIYGQHNCTLIARLNIITLSLGELFK